jgi:ribulose-phosphate 3-epimerase
LDVHLMIDRPIRYVEEFCDAGADIVTIHAEADTLENNLEALRRIRAKGVRAAVSIKPNTPAQVVDDYFDAIDMVLVMTVEPGFGGQKFMADMMPKVRALRKIIDVRFPGVELEVDGGVNLETAQTCIESGANVLVAGSALFKAADTGEFIHTIQKMY